MLIQRIESIPAKIKEYGLKDALLKGIRLVISSYVFKPDFLSYLWYKWFKGKYQCEINGSRMFLDLRGDQGLSRDLFFYRRREVPETEYLMQTNVLKKGDTMFDLGANIGYYVLLESKLVGDTGVVYAMEPVSKCFERLKENVELNNLKNVQLFKVGAGDKNTKAFINVGKNLNLSAMTFYRNADFTSQEEVEMVTIDSFLADKKAPALVRMDVEGFEYAIVAGMTKTLAHPDLQLLIEVHSGILTEEQMRTMFDSFRKNDFDMGVVFKQPPITWLKKDFTMRKSIQWLNKFITHDKITRESSVSEPKSLDELYSILRSSYSGYNILIWKSKTRSVSRIS